jgi:hypothetical protein
MNTRNVSTIALIAAAAAALLTALPASAAAGFGEGTPGYPHEARQGEPMSTASRAEVRAEVRRAMAQGQLAGGELGLPVAEALSLADRDQVRAEAAEAQRLGLLAGGERSVIFTAPQLALIKAAGERATATVVAGSR